MEKLRPFVIYFSIYLLFLDFSASQYTFPDHYFINCGSNSNIQFGQKTFIGDQSSTNSVAVAGKTQTVSTTSTTTQLYQTARVFTDPSSYELQITNNGVHIVRLHFYAFLSSSHDLSQAQFDVSASGFYLLSNFTVKSSSPVIREFLLNVTTAGKFGIFFVPRGTNSLAFVSAIEAFQAPPSFTNAPSGGNGSAQEALQNSILGVVHRINFGGSFINAENDTIGRTWVPDDDYLTNKNSVQKTSIAANNVKYNTRTDPYNAPESVYGTAHMMNQTSSGVLNGSTFFNITWQFNVTRNATHFVRAHFCDIVSPSVAPLTQFVLYINQRYSYSVFPYNVNFTLAVPFYFDLVVDSDGSGIMPISIGPPGNYAAFLNGLEIMELMSARAPTVQVIGSNGSKSQTGLIVGGVVGGVAAFLGILAVAAIIWRKKIWKTKPVDNSDNWQGVSPYGGGSSYSRISDGTLNLGLRLSFADIVHATSSFDAKLIIGEGGFGKVYKGVMRDGTKVAVKRSAPGHGQGLPEFQTEIIVLSKVRYRHLVSLIGYCDEGSEMILVYEFMEKGTLREHLYVSGEGSSNSDGNKWSPTSELSWTQRLDICIGSAKGLHYLHTSSNNGIIHRDVKSTNILLDEFLVAKVADFGLSRSGALDQTHVSTEVKGSFGYLDPEYFKFLQLTQKSDVYSFGVVLLEVLCARPAIAISGKREEVNLADWFLSCHKRGELEKIVEPSLVDKINPNSLRKFAETVQKCLKEYGVERPSMHDVLWDLEYVLQLQQTARPREAHEDSMSDVSWGMALPAVQRLPSLNDPIDEDDDEYEGVPMDSSIPLNASEVFSQLKLGGPR